MSQDLWYKVARKIVKAGQMLMPISDTLIKLLRIIITEEQAKFLLIFKKPSLNFNQIKEKSDLDETQLKKILNNLMYNGVITGTTSRSTGVKVYRLMGPFPGIFEFTFMRGETTEKEKKLVKLFDKLFEEMSQATQKNYDELIPQYKKIIPAIARVVPVEKEIEVPKQIVLPFYEISKIVDKYDDIALTHCYCRHEKDLLGDPCKVTDDRLNCFLFGKTAQFAIEQNFGKSISKEEANKIFQKAEDEGLVHQAFHVHLDPQKEEEAICNCCKCCCGIFQLYYRGAMPYHTQTSYLAVVNEEECIGCGTCVEKCPMETISLIDDIAKINSEKCIGCGVCAHHCPQEAIKLEYNKRDVFIPPKKIAAN